MSAPSERLEVKLLGGTAFLLDGQPVKSMPTRVSQALLIYLLHQPVPVSRETLIDLFFQASEPKQAAANFRATLSRLRKELAPFLNITTRTVAINREANIRLDTQMFEAALEAGQGDAALSVYSGDFLAGFFLRDAPEFEQWVVIERERLRLLAVEAAQRRVAETQQRHDYWAGLHAVNKLLVIDPLLEPMHRLKMELLMRTGQRALALQQYQTTVTLFQEELGLAVEPETTAVYERLSQLTMPPPVHLPAATDQFIGRQDAIKTLTRLLGEPARRLITLFGIGGVGKTRLAVETAVSLSQHTPGMFLNGIYFVSFVGLRANDSPDSIAQQLMKTMNVPLSGGTAPATQAINALRQQEILLLIDNFEHLVETGSRFLADLLREAPGVKLLVTSRQRLNLVEETVFDLDGLPVETADPLASEAGQLFVTHAQRHRFTFTPTNEDVPAIGHMCQLLEGVPLGIELAAGLVRHVSCADIARQIADRLDSLVSPLRNVEPRHRSLRAVFDESWALLTAELRQIFAQLAIFPSSFDRAAAAAIGGATEADLEALMDKALLKRANGRFAIHPLLREFAAEQIAAEAAIPLRNRHCAYFTELIAEKSRTYHRPSYLQHLPGLVAVYDDLALAWRWAVDQLVSEESAEAWEWMNWIRRPFIRLHFQKSWFHQARSLFQEAREKLEADGWHQPEAASQKQLLHAQLTVTEHNAARILGNIPDAIEPTEATIPHLRQHVALDDLFDAYSVLVGCHMQLGQFDPVPDYLDEMEAIAMESRRPVMFGVLYVSRSYYTDYQGDPEGALRYAEQSLEAFREMEDTFYEAIVLDGMARRLFTLNRPDEAAELLRQAYHLADLNDQTLTKGFLQKGLAFYYVEKGDLAAAEAAIAEGRRLFIELNEQRNLVEIDHLQARVAYQRQDWAEMVRCLIASLQRAYSKQIPAYILNNLVYLPLLHWKRGAPLEAVAVAHFLQDEPEMTPGHQAIVAELLTMAQGKLDSDQLHAAEEMAATLELEELSTTFLREGLRWFA